MARPLSGAGISPSEKRQAYPGAPKNACKLGKFGHMGHVREYTRRELVEFARHFRMRCECVIYRGTYEGAVMNVLGFALPRLRPFQMLVLRKPDNG